MTTPRPTGTCPTCGRPDLTLTASGNVWTHHTRPSTATTRGLNCPGGKPTDTKDPAMTQPAGQPLDLDPIQARANAATDPSACGTCRNLTADGKPTEHEQCTRRATLLPAPDAPCYETILDTPEDQRAQLPARFHTPVWDGNGEPNSWHCAVCWGDGWSTRWPCATATERGADVFTPEHLAEQGRTDVNALLDELRQLRAELAESQAATETNREIARVLLGELAALRPAAP